MKCESCGLLFGLSPTTREDVVIPWENMVSWCEEYRRNECFNCHVLHITREHMQKVPFKWKTV